jgi:hypothetical protein
MNLRQFYKQYGLELIPVAMEDLTLTKCVWDGGWFSKPSFTQNHMPNYLLNSFVQKNIMSNAQSDSMLNSFRNQPKLETAFAKINIEFEIEDALELKINENIKLDASFNLKNIKSFDITESKGISIPNSTRLNIDQMLDELKDNYWDEYKNGLRRAYLISELYYGKLSITIDMDFESDFEVALPNSTQNYSNKLKLGRNITYEFENNKVPFAMKIERIKFFNS